MRARMGFYPYRLTLIKKFGQLSRVQNFGTLGTDVVLD